MTLIKKRENTTLIRHNLFELSHQIRLNCCVNNDDHYIAPITFNIFNIQADSITQNSDFYKMEMLQMHTLYQLNNLKQKYVH